MKRDEMLLKMQRFHGIRWPMVEGGYITLKEFYDDMLAMQVELGMLPPPAKPFITYLGHTQEGFIKFRNEHTGEEVTVNSITDLTTSINTWEP